MATANLVPNKIAPKYCQDKPAYTQVYAQRVKPEEQAYTQAYALCKREDGEERAQNLLSKLDLTGMEDWTEENQKKARRISSDYHDVFALSSMELGKNSLVNMSSS